MSRKSKYSEDYCRTAVEYLARGHSVAALAAELGVARSSVYEWAKEHPEFDEALKIGQAKAIAYWEKILIDVAREGKGNATAAIFALKNRAPADWRDHAITEHVGKDGGPIRTEDVGGMELARRIAFALARAVPESTD